MKIGEENAKKVAQTLGSEYMSVGCMVVVWFLALQHSRVDTLEERESSKPKLIFWDEKSIFIYI